MDGKRRRSSSTTRKRTAFRSLRSRRTRWRRTGKRRWRSAATDISPSPASRGRWSPRSSGSSGGPMPGPEGAPRARILIVDDHEDNVELLRARLEAWGFATTAASDGEAALALVEQSPPDLILLDVMMPKIDG